MVAKWQAHSSADQVVKFRIADGIEKKNNGLVEFGTRNKGQGKVKVGIVIFTTSPIVLCIQIRVPATYIQYV